MTLVLNIVHLKKTVTVFFTNKTSFKSKLWITAILKRISSQSTIKKDLLIGL